MKGQLLRIFQGVRNFLFSQMNKEFLIFLFFLAISAMFWFMMSLNETYEQELNVPVRITGVPKNVVLTSGTDDTIKVLVRDKGYNLGEFVYGDGVPPININFQTYANHQKGSGVVPQADIQKLLYQRFDPSTKILSVKPERFDFYFNYGLSKVVPLQLAGQAVPDKRFYLARTRFIPQQVTVYASKHVLDSIKYISTKPVNIVNFTDTVIQDVELAHITGVKTVPSKVKVILYPDILTEETIDVTVHAINMPQGKVMRLFPPRVRVRFTVGASMFRNVKADDFSVVVDYNDVAAHPSDKCRLQLRSMPPYVRKAQLEMTQADYLIEQQ